MSKIRKLYFFDKKNALEMVSFLNNSANDSYIDNMMFNPFILLHHIVPLKFKFLPESYVFKEGKDLKAMITVSPSRCPAKQMKIEKLLFEENNYDIAGELIQYAVSRYKAMGTASFIVKVDDYLPDLIKLFISKCGFSQISYEKLWRITRVKKCKYNSKNFRLFRNSDAPSVASLCNDLLLPHFRPLIGKDFREFKEGFFRGLYYCNEYKYLMVDPLSQELIALISIQTNDNNNFVIDLSVSPWKEIDINSLICFARDKIRRRKKRANLFIKTKKYTQNGEKIEQMFLNSGLECVQNQVVLTNSSAKIIQNEENVKKYTSIGSFFAGIATPNS